MALKFLPHDENDGRGRIWFDFVLDRKMLDRHLDALNAGINQAPSGMMLLRLLLEQWSLRLLAIESDSVRAALHYSAIRSLSSIVAHVFRRLNYQIEQIEAFADIRHQRLLLDAVVSSHRTATATAATVDGALSSQSEHESLLAARWLVRAALHGVTLSQLFVRINGGGDGATIAREMDGALSELDAWLRSESKRVAQPLLAVNVACELAQYLTIFLRNIDKASATVRLVADVVDSVALPRLLRQQYESQLLIFAAMQDRSMETSFREPLVELTRLLSFVGTSDARDVVEFVASRLERLLVVDNVEQQLSLQLRDSLPTLLLQHQRALGASTSSSLPSSLPASQSTTAASAPRSLVDIASQTLAGNEAACQRLLRCQFHESGLVREAIEGASWVLIV